MIGPQPQLLVRGFIAILLLSWTRQHLSAAESQWVTTGVTGRLVYVPDAEGDRILDFSNVGYQGRGTALLPESVASVVTVPPQAGDDTSSIQAAINQVSALPLGADGYRGAVQLKAGTYDINSFLEIRASGVVLRGAGRDFGGTVLHGRNPLTGVGNPNQRSLVRVSGSGSRTNVGSTRNMIDKVVPAGSRSFRVDSTSGFAVGDTVRIERPSTQEWIDALGMNNPPNGDPPWMPGSMNIRYDRVITRIEGDRVFIDAPLANSFDAQFGGGTIRAYTWDGAIENIGIENLRGDSDFTSATDENHAWEFIEIGSGQNDDRAQNVWVRNIAAEHFGDSVVVANPSAKWVTVDNAISTNPVSEITGSRRYTYDLSGELGLVTNASADEGRHDFVNNSTRPPGPNVFHNSTATNSNNDSGPHQRWASGTLFDNITVEGDAINVRNRGSFGTTHGWSGANMVVWNSMADSFRIQNPPTAQNWLVGSTGTIVEDTTFGSQPSGNYDSHGTPVTTGGTTSLYEAQMNDAQDIAVFHSQPGSGNWTAAAMWDQQVAPTDSYRVSLRDYLVGDIDSFTNDGSDSVDNAYIDPAWEAAITGASSHPIVGFDSLADNQNVAFTIQHQLDASEQVVHGTLALALRQGGGLIDTDFVRLFDTAPQHRLQLADLGWDTHINTAGTFVGVLDLGTFLDQLQSGSVNVQLNDDTGLDWAIYTIAVATPRGEGNDTQVFIEAGSVVTVDTAVNPIGELSIDGLGTLAIEIAGDNAGQHGEIDVYSTAMIDGSLEVALSGGFQPAAGDSFMLLSADEISGVFDQVTLPDLAPELAWLLDYEPSAVELSVTFSADFNGDRTVDAADLARLNSNFGKLSALQSDGDADGDHDVDGTDLLAWQRQLGSTIVLSNLAQIPEPSAGFLTLHALVIMVGCRLTQRSYPF